MNRTKKTQTYNQSFTSTFDQDPNSSPDIKDLVCQPAWPGAAAAAHCGIYIFLIIKTEVQNSHQNFSLLYGLGLFTIQKVSAHKRTHRKAVFQVCRQKLGSLTDLPVAQSSD